MHNNKYQCYMEAAKQESYKKAYLLTKNIEEFFERSLEERASRQKKIRQKGLTGLGKDRR